MGNIARRAAAEGRTLSAAVARPVTRYHRNHCMPILRAALLLRVLALESSQTPRRLLRYRAPSPCPARSVERGVLHAHRADVGHGVDEWWSRAGVAIQGVAAGRGRGASSPANGLVELLHAFAASPVLSLSSSTPDRPRPPACATHSGTRPTDVGTRGQLHRGRPCRGCAAANPCAPTRPAWAR